MENYDQYREIGSIDFLHALYNEKLSLFTKESDAGKAAAGAASDESPAMRRQQVEAMNADQREYLFRNEQVLRDRPNELQRIRELHADIERDPDRDKLMATMNRYCKWFEEQPQWWRGELQRKTTKDAIKEIKRQLTIQKIVGNEIRLDEKNRQAVVHWMDKYVSEHEHEPNFIEAALSLWPRGGRGPGGQRSAQPRDGASPNGIYSALPAEKKHSVLRELVLRGWQFGNPPIHPADSELASLRASLSPEIRSRLEAKKPDEQTRIVAGWLRKTASSERDEGLADYFEKTLTPQQQDHLMSLPGDEIDRELGQLYMAYLMSQSKPGDANWRNDQPHRGDRPWPGRQRQAALAAPAVPAGWAIRRIGSRATAMSHLLRARNVAHSAVRNKSN